MRKDFKLAVAGAVLVLGVGACQSAGQSASQPPNPTSTAVAIPGSSPTAANQSSNGTVQQASRRPTAGVVDKVGTGQFTVKPNNGAAAVTVNVADQTTYRKQVAATLADVKPGEGISLNGQAGADGTIAATSIQLVDLTQFQRSGNQNGGQRGNPSGGQSGNQSGPGNQDGAGRGQPGNRNGGQGGQRVFGTVESVANGVITVDQVGAQTGQTPVKATVTDKTKIIKTVSGAFSDVAAGANVLVMGPAGADGAVAASSVQILLPGANLPMGGQ